MRDLRTGRECVRAMANITTARRRTAGQTDRQTHMRAEGAAREGGWGFRVGESKVVRVTALETHAARLSTRPCAGLAVRVPESCYSTARGGGRGRRGGVILMVLVPALAARV